MSYINKNKIKNWKKLSEILQTKSPQQCSYRYLKLSNQHKIINWSRNEDIKLMELIETHGFNWEKLSLEMNKPIENIQDRYSNKLDPILKRSKFTEEEDINIINLHQKYSNKWNEIATHFPERNAAMIKNRFYSVLRKKVVRNKEQIFQKFLNAESSLGASFCKLNNTREVEDISTLISKEKSPNVIINENVNDDCEDFFQFEKYLKESKSYRNDNFEQDFKFESKASNISNSPFNDFNVDLYFESFKGKEKINEDNINVCKVDDDSTYNEIKNEFSDFELNNDGLLSKINNLHLKDFEFFKQKINHFAKNKKKSKKNNFKLI